MLHGESFLKTIAYINFEAQNFETIAYINFETRTSDL